MAVASFTAALRAPIVAALVAAAPVGAPPVHAEGAQGATVALVVHPQAMPSAPIRRTGTIDAADWAVFKSRFIRDDGKLVDSFSRAVA